MYQYPNIQNVSTHKSDTKRISIAGSHQVADNAYQERPDPSPYASGQQRQRSADGTMTRFNETMHDRENVSRGKAARDRPE